MGLLDQLGSLLYGAAGKANAFLDDPAGQTKGLLQSRLQDLANGAAANTQAAQYMTRGGPAFQDVGFNQLLNSVVNHGGLLAMTAKAPAYQGAHTPPLRDSGAPLHDLTGGGTVYPDDIYGPMAAQYYGHFGGNHPMDMETIGLAHQLQGKPNAPVTIYRAVPYEPTVAEQIAALEKQKAQYLARRIVPPEWGGSRTSIGNETGFYDHVTNELARLQSLPQEPAPKLSINPGDWVTINRNYAKDHGESALEGKYKIIKKTVRAKDVFTNGDSIHEWGYDPQP